MNCNTIALLALLGLSGSAAASCDLAVTSLKTVDASGKPYTPKLGETYYLRVDWTVTGTATAPYVVHFEMANFTYDWRLNAPGPGNYYAYVGWNLPLDGKFPIKVALDPAGEQNDTNRSNNAASKLMRPQLPAQAFSWYDPRTLYSLHTGTVTLGATSNWTRIIMLTGCPTTDTFQTVIKHQIWLGSPTTTAPTNYPAIRLDVANPVAGQNYTLQQKMTVKVKNCKLNVNKIKDTWNDFASLPPDVQHWLLAEPTVQSDSPQIAAFVDRVMPPNFKNKQSPIKAARSLFLAVVKEISYVTPAPFDALSVLGNKTGDCGGYTALYVASLRHIGIPARTRSGYLEGTNVWHVWPEIYMPSVGWIPQDPTYSDGYDPDGTYAYFFSNMNSLNTRCSIGIGNTFTLTDVNLTANLFQTFYYWGWWQNRGSETASINAVLQSTPIP